MAPPQTGSAPKTYRVAAQAANHEEDQMRIVSQASAVLLLGLAMLAGCADRPTGPVPAVQLAGDWAIDVASGPVCDIDAANWEGDRDRAVLNDLAPRGPLRVGINFGNPNNATRDPVTGRLSGLAVDMACKLAHGTDAQLLVVPYAGIPQILTGLAQGEFDVAFTFDPSLATGSAARAIPHIGVENTYLVPGNASFQSVADVDAPGVLISVGQSNAPDIYLTGTLEHATRSEEHTSELQSRLHLVCRLLLEKKKKTKKHDNPHHILLPQCISYTSR